MKNCLILSTLSLAAILAAGCRNEASVDHAAAPELKAEPGKIHFAQDDPQLSSVNVESVLPAKSSSIQLNGKLVWDDNVTVRVFSPFAGRVLKILVESGQKVEADQPLALIAAPDYGQAQAEYRKAVTDCAQAEHTWSRIKELVEHGAAPKKEAVAAEADLARAQLDLQRTSARLALYGGSTNAVDQVYCLRSPLAGIVVEKNLNPGQEVRPDQMLASSPQLFAPLFVVTDPSKLWLQLDASEKEMPYLTSGLNVTIHSSAYPKENFAGMIDWLSDSLDPSTRTLKVRGRIENPTRQLKAEMLVSVSFDLTTSAKCEIPTRAVFLKGDQHFVFVEMERGDFKVRPVTIGRETPDRTSILEGVQPGDKVVTEGALFLDQYLTARGS